MNDNDKTVFAMLADEAQRTLERAQRWQAEHSNVADYRLTGAIDALAKASRALGMLAKDEHGPEWVAAMAKFRAYLAESEVSA